MMKLENNKKRETLQKAMARRENKDVTNKTTDNNKRSRKRPLDDCCIFQTNKKRKVSRAMVLSEILSIAHLLFASPKHIMKKWNGSLSTDGLVANWVCKKAKLKSSKESVIHGSEPPMSSNWVAVDPGHVNLISAVRYSKEHNQSYLNCYVNKRQKLKTEKCNW